MSMKMSTPLQLPCGITLPNQLIKAPMEEGMADSAQMPDNNLLQAHSQLADGNWGPIITGNVQVDSRSLGTPKDVSIPSPSSKISQTEILSTWQHCASPSQTHGTPTLMQLNHPGRQSILGAGIKGFWTKNWAVPLNNGGNFVGRLIGKLAFGTPREMSLEDIESARGHFTGAAKLADESGFKGVEVHAAHGYLLAQSLSPKSNIRTDAYGGSPANRARLLIEIVRAIRACTSPSFILGVKFNSADNQKNSNGLEDCTEQIPLLQAAGNLRSPSLHLKHLVKGLWEVCTEDLGKLLKFLDVGYLLGLWLVRIEMLGAERE